MKDYAVFGLPCSLCRTVLVEPWAVLPLPTTPWLLMGSGVSAGLWDCLFGSWAHFVVSF